MVAFYPLPFFRPDHTQFRGARQNLGKLAGVMRLQVLYENQSHARVPRQSAEQIEERLKPAGRRTNSNNVEICR